MSQISADRIMLSVYHIYYVYHKMYLRLQMQFLGDGLPVSCLYAKLSSLLLGYIFIQ